MKKFKKGGVSMAQPTIEDMQKALWRKKTADMIKQIKLKEHKQAVFLADRFSIPYKCIIDNWSDRKAQVQNIDGIASVQPAKKEETPFSRFYPRSPNSIPCFWEWLEQERPNRYREIMQQYGNTIAFMYDSTKARANTPTGETPVLNSECYREEYKALHEEYQQANETMRTAADRRYYTARFLKGYDFTTFTEFNFYGCKGQHTAEQLETFRTDCIALQKDFESNPQNYFTKFVPLEYRNIPAPPAE
jgi:hypothetical protein